MQHMSEHNHQVCQAELPHPNMPTRPLLDFGAGYVKRVIDTLPRRGMEPPWDVAMDYKADAKNLRFGSVTDECLKFYSAEQMASKRAINNPAEKTTCERHSKIGAEA